MIRLTIALLLGSLVVSIGCKKPPPQTSGVVETPFGFHVIRTIERREERTVPFEEVNGQIKEFLTGGQREKKLADFVAQFKTKARIEILV